MLNVEDVIEQSRGLASAARGLVRAVFAGRGAVRKCLESTQEKVAQSHVLIRETDKRLASYGTLRGQLETETTPFSLPTRKPRDSEPEQSPQR